MGAGRGLLAGPGGWALAPEGAAVHVADRTAAVADVHLGYEWARAGGGDVVPAHSLAETLAALERLLVRTPITRLIVAGDLVESARRCPRTDRDVGELAGWLRARGVTLVRLRGNHDPVRRPCLPRTFEVAGWTIGHGDAPIPGERLVFGHFHPVLRAGGVTAPCFLVGPATIALPAFSANAAGWNVLSGRLPAILRGRPLRCVAGAGAELLDFGPLDELAGRMAASGHRAPNGCRSGPFRFA